MSDAPPSTFRGKAGNNAPVERTVTINRPARELYDFWRDFTHFPQFMDNIRSVEKLDERRSRWVIEAPAGTSIEFTSRITEDVPGKLIAWESEEGASVPNRGRVEFLDAAPGRGTMVRATISYDPPAGALGKAVAKVLQREPNVQARRDLRRFKQLMETGEITTSASPSGRKSEEPTRQYL
ncbi:MAG: SRPBCC family protein [Pseudomonadota bacterium]|nr:SRPBCC family protein [Pseudomonadota bacterium]